MAKRKTSKESLSDSQIEKEHQPLRLVLLDSHAILHRAYHALPDFTSSAGKPTGALYGLVLMLLKIRDTLKPDYIIAARDLPGPTHRHDVFDGYKATRMKAEDALVSQLEQAPKIFEAFGVPVYQAPGFEADDVLGTIVKKLSHRGDIEVVIATGDMDTLQLVGDHVRVFTLRKGLSDTVLYDAKAVVDRYGFGPERVVDYKALRGDPSDNIPGVKGIGEKTATELIQKFGSLEDIYKTLHSHPSALADAGIKPRIQTLLEEQEEGARFSKQLATIHADAPIDFDMPHRHYHMEDYAQGIAQILDEYEFRSVRERLSGILGAPSQHVAVVEGEDVVIDAKAVREVGVALWLLKSDLTNPSAQDILTYAKTRDFEVAREAIFSSLNATGRLREVYDTIERPLMPIIDRMNEVGILLDVDYIQALQREYSGELNAVALRIFKHAGHEFNINSPKQLGDVLFDELKLVPEKQKKTAGGARTTREEELLKLSDAHPIIADVLTYRELQKLLSTYIEKMPTLVAKDGRLHAEFLQAGTTTGRMASQNPNLQNIPIKTESGRRIRRGFVAPPGFSILAIDYSQIELRIAAGLSGDETLIGIFQRGEDVHTATAAHVFNVPPEQVDKEMRRQAKVINFGILYGMGVNALRTNLGEGVSRDDAAEFLSSYFKNFSGVARYIEQTKADAARLGYTETLFGRRRYFPGFSSSMPNIRAQAERMATNAPIQGTQADIIKLAMIRADDMIAREGWHDKVKLLLQVHDELVYEVKNEDVSTIGNAIRACMESVIDKGVLEGVPILAEMSVGSSWGDVERVHTERTV